MKHNIYKSACSRLPQRNLDAVSASPLLGGCVSAVLEAAGQTRLVFAWSNLWKSGLAHLNARARRTVQQQIAVEPVYRRMRVCIRKYKYV